MSLSDKKNENDEIENQCSVFIVPAEDENCILCGCKTGVNRKTPVNKRRYYVDGCGQLCRECWIETYGCLEIDDFIA